MVVITRERMDQYRTTPLNELFPDLYQRLLDLTEQQQDTLSDLHREIEKTCEHLINLQCCLIRTQSSHVKKVHQMQQEIKTIARYNADIKIPFVCKVCGNHLVDVNVAVMEGVNPHYAHMIETDMCYRCYETADLKDRANRCMEQIDKMLNGAVYEGCSIRYGDNDDGIDYLYFARVDDDTGEVRRFAVKIQNYYKNDDEWFERHPIEHLVDCIEKI
jgi:hypothetical protein